jgi:Fur family transcriptional regulator, ferric uptake regulator
MIRHPPTPSGEPVIAPTCAIFRRYLKRQGLKFTPERAKILEAVLAKEDVFEADQLLFEMRQVGQRVSKATIYRTLKHLLEAQIVSEVLLDSTHAHYQLNIGREPKGHLVCLQTDKIIEFSTPEAAELAQRICREHGLEPVSYQFVVYGMPLEPKRASESGRK